jgi:hypothetical protein
MEYPLLILGADPGKSGGLAVVSLSSDVTVEAHKMPETRNDLIDIIRMYGNKITRAYVERVRSSPQMGVTSAFTFGCNYERVVMALLCADISVEEITPQKWQKELGCLSGGDKNVTKARAQQLFPQLKVTHSIADALLIAEYGRRVR